ncbi:hypothetical protein Hanom_Chr05g00452661 [Helianthus anomalus]
MQAAYALPIGSTAGVQIEGVSPAPLTSVGIIPSAAGETSLLELIFQASINAAISCIMSPPMPTTAVTVTTSPVSTPLPSSVTPSSLFDSFLGNFSATEKEMPTVSAAHEATSVMDAAMSDVGGSSSGIADDGAHLGDDIYLPTINWDPNMQDKRYQPRWKILKDEKYCLKSQLQAAWLRESGFLSEKNKAADDLKRVTANLAYERIIWARDIAEKDWVLAHAKNVQEELERNAITEAQKERYQALTVEVEASNAKAHAKHAKLEEREDHIRKLQQHCDSLVTEKNKLAQSSATHQARLEEAESALEQSNLEVDSLTSQLAALQGDRNLLIANGLVEVFEYLRQSGSFTALLNRLSAAACQSGHHNGVYKGYFECQ